MVDNDQSEEDGPTDAIDFQSRRKLLKALPVAAVGSVAGCSGGDSDSDTETTDSNENGNGGGGNGNGGGGNGNGNGNDGIEKVDVTQRIMWDDKEDLTSLELNALNSSWEGVAPTALFSFWGYTNSMTHPAVMGEDGIVNWGFKEMNYDPDNREYTFVLRDGIKFHRGTEIIGEMTSEDVALYLDIKQTEGLYDAPIDNLKGWTLPDDKTIKIQYSTDVHTQAARMSHHVAPGGSPLRRRSIGAWAHTQGRIAELFEEYKDATTDDAQSEVKQKMVNHQIQTDGESILNGPWMIEEAHPQRLDLKRVPGHPRTVAEHFENNWDKMVVKPVSGAGNLMMDALRQNNVDQAGGDIPADMGVDSIPDNIKVQVNKSWAAMSLMINYGGDVIDPYLRVEERNAAPAHVAKVHQALAYAMDGNNMLTNVFGSRFADIADGIEKPIVGDPGLVEEFLPDLYEDLPSYGPEQKLDMAEQRLREADLTKEGGEWIKPNGDPLKLVLDGPSGEGAWLSGSSTILTAVKDLGINVEFNRREISTWIGDIFDTNYGMSAADSMMKFHSPDLVAGTNLMSDDYWWAWLGMNQPGVYDVPPVGDFEGEATETMDADKLLSEQLKGGLEKNPDAARKLIWTQAYHVPKIPIATKFQTFRMNTNHFEWPIPDNEQYYLADQESNITSTLDQAYVVYTRGSPGQIARSE